MYKNATEMFFFLIWQYTCWYISDNRHFSHSLYFETCSICTWAYFSECTFSMWFIWHNLKLSCASAWSVSCKSVHEHKSLSHGDLYPSPYCVNGSASRRPSLAVCVYCLPAQLVLIGSALPSDRTMFAFAVCLGKSLLSSNRARLE